MKPFILSALTAILPAGALLADTPQLWQSVGYGMILELADDQATLYQQSSFACLPLATSRDVAVTENGGRIDDLTITGVGRFTDKLTAEMYRNGDQLQVDFGKASLITFDPLSTLPVACTQSVSNDPATTFDVLWHFFNEHYAYFDQRGVDWNASYATYRPNLDGFLVGRGKLNDTISAMLREIGDGHVNLFRLFGDEDFGTYPDWIDDLDGNAQTLIVQLIRNHVQGEVTQVGEAMGYGRTADNIGYIVLAGMEGGLVESGALAEAMADMQAMFDGVDAIVIDARINFGGDDELGFALAGYLTDTPVPIGSKDVYEKGEWLDVTDLVIEPAEITFDVPVYLFTTDLTISAGETFALALSQFDNVTSVGMPTHGTLSDMFYVALPNGWIATLSNERYLDMAGNDYETHGVPVDIPVRINVADLLAGQDASYDAMLTHLQR